MDSKTARKIKDKNSKIEQLLAKAMWNSGLRYRKQCREVFGKPDFCFKGKKIAIFCDSEFWHGKKFLEGEGFKTNSDFWETKIKKNIERDIKVNQRLENEGWKVIRLWGKEIKDDRAQCVKKIKRVMEQR